MPTEVILPRVDMDMVEGKIAHWYVKEGEAVRKGQVLFEIETDKATMEVDATADGVLHGVNGEIGVPMPVGQVVGWIFGPDEALPGAAGVAEASTDPAQAATTPAAGPVLPESATALRADPSSPPAASRSAEPVAEAGPLLRATPLARSLARAQGVDLATLQGSGPNGRIVAADLPAGSPQAAEAKATNDEAVHLQWMRRGSGAPLVLLHGFGADHGSWRPLLQQLPDGFPVIGIDLPNHGKSAAAPARTLDDLARPVRDRLDREGVVDLHLLGHSLGGAVALSLAALAGGRVRSLTLLAPAGLGPEVDAAFLDGLVGAEDEAALKPVLARLFYRPALLTGAFVATSWQQLRAPQRRAALAELAAHLMPRGRLAQDGRSLLADIKVPVQVVWGRADRIVAAQQAFDLPPHVGVHLLPEVGHLPQIEAVALVGALATHLMRRP